jgi:predicted house-cleaning noncanonical NTP pyrophosphatase (MazG superfamily)
MESLENNIPQPFEKLVRDGIPRIIQEKGEVAVVRYVEGVEYRALLDTKLQEEVVELLAAKTPEERAEEMADVLEVLMALARIDGTTMEAVESVRLAKREKRGGFEEGAVLLMNSE